MVTTIISVVNSVDFLDKPMAWLTYRVFQSTRDSHSVDFLGVSLVFSCSLGTKGVSTASGVIE